MSFAAKYPGTCLADECVYTDSRIRVDDQVEFNNDDEIMHTECARRQREPVDKCPHCNCIHNGGCW